jgi:TonB family protein
MDRPGPLSFRLLLLLCLIPVAGTLSAQLTTAATLTTPPNINYPPIAKAAHVQGEVVVSFSIDSEGRTVSVQTLSGQPMLGGVVENQIRQWHFRTPLPVASQNDFVATYTFRLGNEQLNLDDDLDAPPFVPCCGDYLHLPSVSTVIGDVRSTDGSQKIDVSPTATAAKLPCPGNSDPTPPHETRLDDFVELYRSLCSQQCTDYLVRVYRNGRVDWHGWHNVAILGDLTSQISPAAAESLLALFQTPDFWSVCSVELDPRVPEHDPDMAFLSPSITVSIDGHKKSVDLTPQSLGDGTPAEKLMWAIDKAADTHHWRHGDSAAEPYTNMRDDLILPKPGITALMRATYRFNPANAQQTLEPLKHLIATGADIDATDESGWTALFYATYLDSYDPTAVNLLLNAHANVNHASFHGDTALMIAAYNGELSENLLAKGAGINARNAEGVTTLMLLAQHVDPDEIQQALAAKADASSQDNVGRTALDYLRAASCGNPLIPLPKQWNQLAPQGPPPCPSTSENFLKTQALLRNAMKKP